MSVFIIAEAGVNHNGDAERALAMVDAAKATGADAVKFQTFSADKLAAPGAEKADYQKRETGDGGQHGMLKALEMSEDLHHRLIARCVEVGVEFMSTPFDEEAADFLIAAGMKRIKVPSGEIVNHPFLRHLAALDRPMIVSTGMATMEEITEAVAVIAETRRKQGLTAPLDQVVSILHCTSNYPAAPSDVNLRAMRTIGEITGLPVGYSDHTLGLAVSTAAVALGAAVIEKHFTLDPTLPGPDHRASLTVAELTALVRQIRDVEAALGSAVKAPTAAEMPVRAVARRSVMARRDLPAGHVLSADDLILLRPANGIQPRFLDALPGRTLRADVEAGQPLNWDLLSGEAMS
ncbi:N-acetylneuraminate synthase [Brevundimonas sp.]|uniref:N-acetylneuraminate synthase n=1 Tax=Brevundimonas sp. TaxID=1871086 RepID=UPI002D3D9433|nr:N-acetylneuraminate synthase [Brevundimonas sp.]HYC73589.1 N-acetylneuraminate synthase [Brevundimonas sp.]